MTLPNTSSPDRKSMLFVCHMSCSNKAAVHQKGDDVIRLGSVRGAKRERTEDLMLFLNTLSLDRTQFFCCRMLSINQGAFYSKGDDVIWLWVSETRSSLKGAGLDAISKTFLTGNHSKIDSAACCPLTDVSSRGCLRRRATVASETDAFPNSSSSNQIRRKFPSARCPLMKALNTNKAMM
jgi:hypothetical protein